jgi:hypothetical protein
VTQVHVESEEAASASSLVSTPDVGQNKPSLHDIMMATDHRHCLQVSADLPEIRISSTV